MSCIQNYTGVLVLLLITLMLSLAGCGDTTYMQGKRLYAVNCQNCHMEDGSGLGGLIPALSSSVQIGSTNFACIIKNGLNDTIFQDSTYLLKQMPSFKKFSATEITNIVNYVNANSAALNSHLEASVSGLRVLCSADVRSHWLAFAGFSLALPSLT